MAPQKISRKDSEGSLCRLHTCLLTLRKRFFSIMWWGSWVPKWVERCNKTIWLGRCERQRMQCLINFNCILFFWCKTTFIARIDTKKSCFYAQCLSNITLDIYSVIIEMKWHIKRNSIIGEKSTKTVAKNRTENVLLRNRFMRKVKMVSGNYGR